jgi:hypothetical protein
LPLIHADFNYPHVLARLRRPTRGAAKPRQAPGDCDAPTSRGMAPSELLIM